MKTKKRIIVFAIFLLIFSFSELKAQTYVLTNSLSCNVTLQYEVWKGNGGACVVCTFGSITVTANSSTNLPVCAGFTDVCINITDIGGDLPPSNHTSLNNCHVMTPYGQTGTTSTSSACGVISWSASQSTSGWIIQ